MCGGVNIRYGTKQIEYENSGQAPDPNVVFQVSDLNPQEPPLPNDLILNSDGCFYKVNTVSDDSIATVRLTLQGTGGGFGGGGGGTGDGSASYSINVIPGACIFSKEDEKMSVSFQGIASAETANYIQRVSLTLGFPEDNEHTPFFVREGQYAIGTIENPVIHDKVISLVPYQNLFDSKAKTVYLNTVDAYGVNRSKKFTVSIVELTLGMKKESIIKSSENTYQYACDVSGATEGISNKKVTFSIYAGDNIYGEPIITQVQEVDNNFHGTNKIFSLNLEKLPHGVYTLAVQMSANIAGSTQVIPSNILTHKLIRFIPGTQGALFAVNAPEKAEQYTNAYLDLMIASDETNKNYTVEIVIDGKTEQPIVAAINTLTTKTLYFETKGTYTVTITVVEMSTLTQTFSITVSEYTGKLPVIDPTEPSLMLYLNPKGRSNSDLNREEWKEYNGKHTALLSNFYFGNTSGWLEDAAGTSYLQLASGGRLTIPTFKPFAEDPTKASAVNSTMGYGMTIELDFEVNGVTDYDAELISCVSKDASNINKVGFSITGNKIQFYNSSKNGGDSGSLVNINLVEGKRIRLSFVIEPNNDDYPFPMCLTYINGTISGAAIYSKQDSYIDSAYPAQLVVDSSYAQIKLYGVRFYSNALADSDILNNFTASLPTLEERQNRFDTNNVYNLDVIDFNNVSSEYYDLQVPYMAIVGGWGCDPEDKWKTLPADKVGAAALPTGKKDYRLIDVSVKYPKIDYFKGYKDYSYKNEYSNGGGMTENFGTRADNGGCIMYAQGTSSMEYPVKNLRLRWKKDKYFYTVRPDIAPVEIICMKADYMESSGSHNTGAANLVDDLYSGASMKSPGQQHFGPSESNPTAKKIVTCIKGHPCLIFWSPSGEKGTFQYIGKYNLNLDKATPEPFGFNHDDSFGWLPEGEKYWKVQYGTQNEATGAWEDVFVGQAEPAEGADYVPGQTETEETVGTGEKINSIHCFEFLDNAIPVCNFKRRPKKYIEDPERPGEMIPDPSDGYFSYEETWYNGFDVGKGEIKPGWTVGFESRYPEDRVGYHDADMLYPMASWLSELYYLKTEGSNPEIGPTEDDIAYANARFKNEYHIHFNKDFLTFYYIVTEVLLMADSRVKNMMIATWNKHTDSYYPLKESVDEDGKKTWIPDTTQEPITGSYYVWYPIFYDMDTMMGLDNTGVNRFAYYAEDDDPSTYNGDEVLWNFVRDCLPGDLDAMYNRLENAGLNVDLTETGEYSGKSILPYFNNNQANMANEAFYNGDARYKYIRPAVDGYWDGLNNEAVPPGKAPYLYAAQGDRSLQREYFITNRIKFLRGKHGSEDFQTQDRITFRLYNPTGQEANFTDSNGVNHSASVRNDVAAPSTQFTFKSLQTCYAGALVGANGVLVKQRFNGEDTQSFTVESEGANGTEAYLLGVSNLKDLGDLSNKYPQKFIMNGSNKLRTLTLGNPHKDYYNPFWRPEGGNSEAIGLTGCTYLQEFNLQNCSTYNAQIDFRECPVIEKILLTGSNTSNLMLPVNGALKELRLPTSITKLSINSHQYLTTDFSVGTYEYGSDNKIGGNGRYVDDFSYLTELTIINTPIDSYNLVSKASNLEGYYFEGFNWIIEGKNNDDQYVKTTDPQKKPGKIYYIWDAATRTYVPATDDQFANNYPLIKEKRMLKENGTITSIPILDYLASLIARKDQVPVDRKTALTGTITIKTPANINEFQIYQKYNPIYPNIKFEYDKSVIESGGHTLTKAHKIEFYNVPNINADTEAYYTVLTDGNYTMNELIKASGPSGMNLMLPTMQSTTDTDYIFSGKWKVVYLDRPGAAETIYDMATDFDFKPTSDMKLEPIYDTATRLYTVKFYDYDTVNPKIHKTVKYTYQQVMSENPETPMYLNRPDDKQLESEFHRYAFKGWITEKDFRNLIENPKPDTIDLETKVITVSSDGMSLYPLYEMEDARYVASDLKYFEITQGTIQHPKVIINPDGSTKDTEIMELRNQYILKVKDIYRKSLSGKITLPSKDANNNIITVVGSIGDSSSNISEIYFLPDHKYASIGGDSNNSGFAFMTKLQRIYFPENNDSLKYLADSTFHTNSNLSVINNFPNSIEYIGDKCFRGDSQLKLAYLPENLQYIGTEAFYNCSAVTFEKFPLGLTTILAKTFGGCDRIMLNTFGRNLSNIEMGALENNITIICNNAFNQGFGRYTAVGVENLYIYNSVQYVDSSGSFYMYGSEHGLMVHDESGLIADASMFDIFGRNISISR